MRKEIGLAIVILELAAISCGRTPQINQPPPLITPVSLVTATPEMYAQTQYVLPRFMVEESLYAGIDTSSYDLHRDEKLINKFSKLMKPQIEAFNRQFIDPEMKRRAGIKISGIPSASPYLFQLVVDGKEYFYAGSGKDGEGGFFVQLDQNAKPKLAQEGSENIPSVDTIGDNLFQIIWEVNGHDVDLRLGTEIVSALSKRQTIELIRENEGLLTATLRKATEKAGGNAPLPYRLEIDTHGKMRFVEVNGKSVKIISLP